MDIDFDSSAGCLSSVDRDVDSRVQFTRELNSDFDTDISTSNRYDIDMDSRISTNVETNFDFDSSQSTAMALPEIGISEAGEFMWFADSSNPEPHQ